MRPNTTACSGNTPLVQHLGHLAVGKALRLHLGKQGGVLLRKAVSVGLALFYGGADIVGTCSAQSDAHHRVHYAQR